MKIAYITYQYPTLTQTFIQREIKTVASQGVQIEVHAMRGQKVPADYILPPNVTLHPYFLSQLWLLIFQVPSELLRDPSLILSGIRFLQGKKWRGIDNFLINLLGLGFAFAQADRFRRSDVDHYHGVWATGMTTAAALLAQMTGKTFSMGAHAFDVYRHGGDLFLEDKLHRSSFVHTTTLANVRHLKGLVPRANVILSRRGLESLPDLSLRKKGESSEAFQMLSVARLVSKKGLEYQIQICQELKSQGFNFRHRIIGDGPLRESLKKQINQAGLEQEVELVGALTQRDVQSYYAQSDLFWHAGLVDGEGDRDGLPNVIPEAFSWGLCVLSSPTPGADEAVVHEVTGWIVDPRKIKDSAQAIQFLANQSALRTQLGAAGRLWVEENFMSFKNAQILVKAYQNSVQNKKED
ncbi:MAG: glycosyltransferase [Verrucomicrobiota bacterium]